MLIPRKPLDEEGNEIDPREELVQRLLEYKRYKSVIEDMRKLEEQRSKMQHRGNTSGELRKIAEKALVDVELQSVTLFKLMRAFERVLRRLEDRNRKPPVHRVYNFSYSIQEQQIYLLSSIKPGQRRSFVDIFGGCKERMHAVITFLALLELLNLQKIHCVEGIGINNFWLEAPKEQSAFGEEE